MLINESNYGDRQEGKMVKGGVFVVAQRIIRYEVVRAMGLGFLLANRVERKEEVGLGGHVLYVCPASQD